MNWRYVLDVVLSKDKVVVVVDKYLQSVDEIHRAMTDIFGEVQKISGRTPYRALREVALRQGLNPPILGIPTESLLRKIKDNGKAYLLVDPEPDTVKFFSRFEKSKIVAVIRRNSKALDYRKIFYTKKPDNIYCLPNEVDDWNKLSPKEFFILKLSNIDKRYLDVLEIICNNHGITTGEIWQKLKHVSSRMVNHYITFLEDQLLIKRNIISRGKYGRTSYCYPIHEAVCEALKHIRSNW